MLKKANVVNKGLIVKDFSLFSDSLKIFDYELDRRICQNIPR